MSARRRRYVLAATLLAGDVSAGLWGRHSFKAARARRSEAAYQSALDLHSRSVKPGMMRQQVEQYLEAKGLRYTQMCCVNDRTALADLVKMGEEDSPWYCSELRISVAFVFAASEPHSPLESRNSDVVQGVKLFRQFVGCL